MGNTVEIQKGRHPGKSQKRPDSARPKEDILGVQKAQDLYQKILEAAPDAMVFVEKSGRTILLNAQMENLFGYSREELVGKDLDVLIPDRFRKQHREHVGRFFANPRLRPIGSGLKIYGLKKDGTEFRADISLSPLDVGGKLLVIASIRDITDRVRAEEQIELNYRIQRVISDILKISLEQTSQEEQLHKILELVVSIPDPALRAKGLIHFLDDARGTLVLKAQYGFSEDEEIPPKEDLLAQPDALKGLSCEVVSTGDADAPYQIIYKQSASFVHYCIPICTGQKVIGIISLFTREWRPPRPEEEVFLRAAAHALAIIAKHYQIEAERQNLLERLSQSEKYAALGRISANVADEIRNPLTVVGGFARRLQKKTGEKTEEREYAGFIISEVNRLEEILKDILAYSKMATPQLKGARIHEIIDEVLKVYQDACKARSIAVQKSYGATPEIPIDLNRVREVITNLVSNAIDAMGEGGTLFLSTAKVETNGQAFVTVTIRDTGEGIPADKLGKIFEPFFTTKISKRGIGLGLSIAKKIMEDHGGFITVESKVGTGSAFSLYFPSSPPEAHHPGF